VVPMRPISQRTETDAIFRFESAYPSKRTREELSLSMCFALPPKADMGQT